MLVGRGAPNAKGCSRKLDKGGAAWDELQGIFKGPQTLVDGRQLEREGRQMYKASVNAPEAEGGGIGGLMMVEEAGRMERCGVGEPRLLRKAQMGYSSSGGLEVEGTPRPSNPQVPRSFATVMSSSLRRR